MNDIGLIQRDVDKPDVCDLGNFTNTVRFARIIDVYDASVLDSTGDSKNYGSVSIVYLDSLSTSPVLVPVLSTWYSWTRGAGIMFMPEQNDIVACVNQLNGYPLIIGFLPYKWDESINKVVKDNRCVGDTRPLYKGEVVIKGSSGGDVVIDKNGTVTIGGTDYSISEKVVSVVDGYNTEYSFDRVLPQVNSGISKTIIGNSYMFDGTVKNVGNFPQIFECGSSTTDRVSVILPFAKEVKFTLPSDVEIVDVVSVNVLSGGTSNTSTRAISSKTLKSSQYHLQCSNIYPIGSLDPSHKDYKPATVDKNLYGYTLSLNTDNITGNAIQLDYISRRFIGGIRVNSAGDVFIDGRNVVVRSENERSNVLLKRNGEASISGTSTSTIGTPGYGYIQCSQNNIIYSTGILGEGIISDDSMTKAKLHEVLSSADGSKAYFYVSDTLPLLRVEKTGLTTWSFSGVTRDEYISLDVSTKASVKKLLFSQNSKLFTSTKLEEMLNTDVPSYGELKRLS